MHLSDKLALEYLKFRNKCDFDNKIIEALLCYFKSEFIFTKEQLENASKEIASFDAPRFYPLINKIAKFKITLCDDNDDFPFVNIFGDKIENNLSATFKTGESRNKAIDHFKALLRQANSIFIYDAYLKFDKLEQLVQECQINCDIYLKKNKYDELNQKSKLQQISQNIKIDKSYHLNQNNTHDRYITIDGKIEIILTSGIDHLFSQNKDFTYILRDINKA